MITPIRLAQIVAVVTPRATKHRAGAFRQHVFRFALIILAWCATVLPAAAQDIQYTQGSTSTLTKSLTIPLRVYPGRGAASLPVTLYYSSKVWNFKYKSANTVETITEARYGEHSGAGWTSSLNVPVIEWPEESDIYNFNGKPFCDTCGSAQTAYRVSRVYIHMPDGSTHELRKPENASNMAEIIHTGPVVKTGDFYAIDGSRMRYYGETPYTGTLYMADGTRYVFGHDSNGSPLVRFIERNGNTLIFSGGQWTDTLGRTLALPPANSYTATYPGNYSYTLPGIGGSISYTFRWKRLSEQGVLTPDPLTGEPPALRYAGDYYRANGAVAGPLSPSLFTSHDNGETVTYVTGPNAVFDQVVLAEIVLPNNTSYKFGYNEYGEITKVIYPTGGYERFQYAQITPLGNASGPYPQTSRGVVSCWVSATGNPTDEVQWTSQVKTASPNIYWIETKNPDQTVSQSYLYNILPTAGTGGVYNQFGFEDSRNGNVYDERLYAPGPNNTLGPMLRRTLTEWVQTSITRPSPFPITNSRSWTATRNPRPGKEVSLILDTGGDALAKTMTYSYDTTHQFTTGLDLTTSTESQFADVDSYTAQNGVIGAMGAGQTASTVVTAYLDDFNYRDKNILGLSSSVILYGAGGQAASKTVMGYDETALKLYNDFGNDWTDPGTIRGNVTTVRRYLDPSAEIPLNQECPVAVCMDTRSSFDQAGNAWKVKNARGIETETAYSAQFKYAYATLLTTAIPDPQGVQGSVAAFTSSSVFDDATGLVLSTTDANGQTTNFSYRDEQNVPDPLNRLRKVTRPDGSWTKYEFHETVGDWYNLTQTQLDATRVTKTYQFFDALGRASRSLTSEDLSAGGSEITYLASDTQYDDMGRVWRVSNPYRVQGLNAAVNPLGYWTTTVYDELGRVKTVTLPDQTSVQTNYQGVYTTVTDQAGKQRRQKTDALGRIVRVDEMNSSGQLGSIEEPLQATHYEYNTQGNLIHVQQGAGVNTQHRYFRYDALSRLTHERQVEQNATFTFFDPLTSNNQWSRKLVYDENGYRGLLTSQWDARNIHTQYTYDNLNRVRQITYSDSTPTVKYFYDSVRFTVAGEQRPIHNLERLAEVQTLAAGDAPATAQSYNYDLRGRVINSRQTVDVNSYTMGYGYNAAGALTSETYPSGRVVNLDYDAAARLTSVTSGGQTYASQFTYGAHGLLTAMSLGNGTIESYDYNTRRQLKTLSLTKDNGTLQRYEYKYGRVNADGSVDETQDNGQIGRIEAWVGASKQWQQRFGYDNLGRLSQASEYRGDDNQRSYLINYDYDAFGNRYQYAASNPVSTNPLPYVAVEDGQISKLTNRFTSGLTYDNAGNVETDQKFRGRQYLYDANNRQRWSAHTDGSSPVVAVYDGTGQRVAIKVNGVVNDVMVYDALGMLVAEYSINANTGSGGAKYIFADHQSSTRVLTNANGGVISRQDYQPFGEELGAVGLRSTDPFYGGANNVRRGYARMEKDEATDMAHTLWRKYDMRSGRWTSPDPYGGSMEIASPQTINRYSYVNNDPLNLIDPTGLMLSDIGVYQTSNPAVADRLEQKMVQIVQRNTTQGSSQSTPGLNPFAGPTVRSMYGNRPWARGGTGNIQFSSQRNEFASPSVSAMLAGPAPVVGNATAMQQGLISSGFVEAARRMREIPSCAEFFGGASNGRQAMRSLNPYIDAAMHPSGHPQGEMRPNGMAINPNGDSAFVAPDDESRTFYMRTPQGMREITLPGVQARAFALSHEAGHEANRFGDTDQDAFVHPTWINNFTNNYKIWRACFSEVTSRPSRTFPVPGLPR